MAEHMAAVMGEGEEALGAYRKIGALRPSALSSYCLGKFASDVGETSIAGGLAEKPLVSFT
jgi:hypothetical protein